MGNGLMSNDPYVRLARYYDLFVEPSSRALRQFVFNTYKIKKGMKVLEVGCGTGANLMFFQSDRAEIYGIDLSPSMVEAAKQKLGDYAQIELGDAAGMPYPDSSFDLVIAMLTLHEMPNHIRTSAVREMRRVKKENGDLMLIDYHHSPCKDFKGFAYRAMILCYEIAAGREHFKNYRNFIKHKGLSGLIEQNNLPVKQKKVLGYGNIILAVT